jgi:Glycosyl hydrolase family 10
MGTLTFLLPENLSADTAREIERACVAGGPDSMPWLTSTQVHNGQLIVSRHADESGFVLVPWEVPGAGLLMGATTTLMERELPYEFEVELARGKVNQLRCQAEEWHTGGLVLSAALKDGIRDVSNCFGRAALESAQGSAQDRARTQARQALASSYRIAHDLADAYTKQVFQVRHERSPALEVGLGCRVAAAVPPEHGPLLVEAFNHLDIQFPWKTIESTAGTYRWETQDALVDWAEKHGLQITAGPLIDFSFSQLPAWLAGRAQDAAAIARVATNFIAAAMERYRDRVRRWHLVTAVNNAAIFSLTEEDLLRLTATIAQAAREADPQSELILGLAQPWGEYLAVQERAQSPFVFAETVLRADLNLAALDLELVMGVGARGSYCRDLLETSRLLDLYALLGIPLRITLGYPSSTAADAAADPSLATPNGYWRGGPSPMHQAEWTAAFAALVLCKPYVQSVQWVHLGDAAPHQFPNCGLIDATGKVKPALESLQLLRKEHLR